MVRTMRNMDSIMDFVYKGRVFGVFGCAEIQPCCVLGKLGVLYYVLYIDQQRKRYNDITSVAFPSIDF